MIEVFKLVVTFLVGIIAAFIGTSVGGCGLISIPALIFLGLSSQSAVATGKLGSLGLVLAGIYRFHKGGKINYRIGIPIALLSLIGAYFGATTLTKLSGEDLNKYVGVVILVILPVLLLKKDFGIAKKPKSNLFLKTIGYLAFLPLGFWGGVFGPGYAIFSTYVLIFVFGQTFLESAGTRKILGLGVTILSLVIFAHKGILDWLYGGALFAGMALGSYLGASYGIKKGDRWVRGLFIIVVLISALKLLI